ncbi:MAG TPA: MFS transporter [Candidatus Acidoferrales bacterium]|jgi:MFS family permease|nr:MFS transporter [Candidatus Acidoferrales bacterium]
MTQKAEFYGWKLLAVFWLIVFTNFAFPLYGASVINTYMAADLHMNRAALGAAYGFFQWMVGLPAPLVAICINKKGVRLTTLAGCVTVVAGALLMAFVVRAVWQVYLIFGVVVGLGALSGGILGAQASMGRWFVKHKARAITLVHTGSSFGGFVAAPVLNHTIAAFGGNWRTGWMLIAALSCVASLLAFFFIKESPADLGQVPDGAAEPELQAASAPVRAGRRGVYKTAEAWTFGEVFRTPAIWMFLVAILGFSAGYPLFLAQGVAHLRDLGYTPGAAAFSVSVMLLASLCGTLLFAAIADAIEPRLVWAAASVLFGAGMILARHASGSAGLYLYAICLGAGFGISFSSMMALPANYYGPRAYAPIVAVVIAVGTTAGAAGPFAAGYIYDRLGSYDPAFYAVSALSFFAAVLLLFATPPVHKRARSFVPAAR